MPKKSRRRGKFRKFKVQSKPTPLVAKAVVQPPTPQAVLPKQAPATKPPMTVADMATRYQYVLPELRRIAIIAGVMFLIIVILSFFFR